MPSARWRSRTWQMMASISVGSTLGIGSMSPKVPVVGCYAFVDGVVEREVGVMSDLVEAVD